jgi:hypothetical protein
LRMKAADASKRPLLHKTLIALETARPRREAPRAIAIVG